MKVSSFLVNNVILNQHIKHIYRNTLNQLVQYSLELHFGKPLSSFDFGCLTKYRRNRFYFGQLSLHSKVKVPFTKTDSFMYMMHGHMYQCNQCDYKASLKGTLSRHKKSIHEGIKFPCAQCDYKARLQKRQNY